MGMKDVCGRAKREREYLDSIHVRSCTRCGSRFCADKRRRAGIRKTSRAAEMPSWKSRPAPSNIVAVLQSHDE